MVTGAILVLLSVASIAEPSLRVPQEINPFSYELFIKPAIAEAAFYGNVSVNFETTGPMVEIPIHALDLIITKASLIGPNGKIESRNLKYLRKDEMVSLQLLEEIPAANYTMNFEFTGLLDSKMDGFYRSTYRMPEDENDRYLATTKFEPTSARAAFPCFDEPELKAKFNIRVTHSTEGGYTALSNNANMSSVPGPGENEMTVQFAETPEMSTYLVAFIVSDFKALDPVVVRNEGGQDFPLRVFSSPHLVNRTAFALKAGKEILEYFISYFGIPYPLPKMDFISIPDFGSGAMENWGLITFREVRLITDADEAFSNGRKIAKVIAHELSHQWFGNLVTMKWWNDLWLNEGFARFMEYKGALEGFSGGEKWREEDYGIHEVIIDTLEKDASLGSHPVVTDVSEVAQISEMFDSISYGKGASILRMFEHMLGEDEFKKGVQNYLNKHLYGSADSQDLFNALSEEVNLTSAMHTWTKQEGFPLVTITRSKDKVYASQTRYVNDIDAEWERESSPYRYMWDIPLCYTNGNNSEENKVWMKRDMMKMDLQVGNVDSWLKLNCKLSGFYRVMYDSKSYESLILQLNVDPLVFSAVDRANLLDDAFNLASSGHTSYVIPLKMAKYLAKERQRMPLVVGFNHLFALRSHLMRHSDHLTDFIKNIAYNVYSRMIGNITWDFTKQQLNSDLEQYILLLACRSGLEACRNPVSSYFRQWVQNGTEIHPTLRYLVYVYGMKYSGDENDWKILFDRYQTEVDPNERDVLLSALASARLPDCKERLLNSSLNSSVVRPQDYFLLLSRIGAHNSKMAWKYYKENYKAIVAKFGLRNRGLGSSLETILAKSYTKKSVENVLEFYRQYPDAGAAAGSRKKALHKMYMNARWQERSQSVDNFFHTSSPTVSLKKIEKEWLKSRRSIKGL